MLVEFSYSKKHSKLNPYINRHAIVLIKLISIQLPHTSSATPMATIHWVCPNTLKLTTNEYQGMNPYFVISRMKYQQSLFPPPTGCCITHQECMNHEVVQIEI